MIIYNTSVTLFKAGFRLNRFSSFTSAMAEALENIKVQQTEKSKKPPYKSRYNGRLKKRQWEDKDEVDESTKEKRANFDPAERIKKKKCAILLGYSGVNYYGMQRNPGMKTIEEDLFVAMQKNNWINEDAFKQPQLIQFQRAARTDKGVSAARQCCSIKLPENLNIDNLNKDLPEQIRIFSLKRVTKGFNAKDQCNARTYTYTLPTAAFADHTNEVDFKTFRISEEKITHLNKILKLFEGTRNFHNFTSRKEYLDPSSKRYIISFTCDQPFITSENIEFATIKIKGQSFMLHQIRKMVGLTLAVLRGHTSEDTIAKTFTEARLDIPMAPGLGLVLDQVHYEKYNKRYGDDGLHEPLIWEKEEHEIQEFINKYIYSTIFETELKEKSMMTWLETLGMHSYDVREDKPKVVGDGEKGDDDDDEE